MRDALTAYIRAGYSGLYIVSHEEPRAQAMVRDIGVELGYSILDWNCVRGTLNVMDGTVDDVKDPLKALSKVMDMADNTLYVLEDFHLYLEKAIPTLIRMFKDALNYGKQHAVVIIVLGCRQCMPPELEKIMTVLDFDLPDKETLLQIADNLSEGFENKPEFDRDVLAGAMRGMTVYEAENALSLSYCKTQQFSEEIISREKVQAIEKSGILKFEEEHRTVADIGGLHALKDFARSLKGIYTQDALDFGLEYPKGVLLTGIPGTGKTLTSKILAHELGLPLLSLDMGKLFGSLVGQTEANTREFIKLAEAVAPVLVRIDEIEKGLAGANSSGAGDSGTSARSFGTLLSWLQDRKAPVFIAATANNVGNLPSEFSRIGRWDAMFFVDLPQDGEREDIWRIHIRKRKRDPEQFDLAPLVAASKGYTGAEIEQAIVSALRQAFQSANKVLTNEMMVEALLNMVPIAKTMESTVSEMRTWAKGLARNASYPQQSVTPSTRKIAAANTKKPKPF